MTTHSCSYLALGDSYSIGEGVSIHDSFPYQTVRILRTAGILFSAPEIIARTGWTTGELKTGMAAAHLLPRYDFVSLLIGVNNEYRGQSLQEYETEFEGLLRQAIALARNRPANTIVLSIPDWSVTPFAHASLPDKFGRGKEKIFCEIDEFNASAGKISTRYHVDFIDITTHTRSHASAPTPHAEPGPGNGAPETSPWIVSDGLHPSGREYAHWAELLAARIKEKL